MEQPVFLYFCKGIIYCIYAVWSIRSLRRFGFNKIEVSVTNQKEKSFFAKHCPDIKCTIVSADFNGYPQMSYKVFAVKNYLEQVGIIHEGDRIVICDSDVLWMKDPSSLFERFKGENWVHKITAVNPNDYNVHSSEILTSNIGLRTKVHYIERYGLERYPDFNLNAGLFMLNKKDFINVWQNMYDFVVSLPPSEMLMSDAICALVYAKLELVPVSDKENIKHFGVQNISSPFNVFSFKYAKEDVAKDSGYEVAKHFYRDQRVEMLNEVKQLGLDSDNLIKIVRRYFFRKRFLVDIPRKIKRLFLNLSIKEKS